MIQYIYILAYTGIYWHILFVLMCTGEKLSSNSKSPFPNKQKTKQNTEQNNKQTNNPVQGVFTNEFY